MWKSTMFMGLEGDKLDEHSDPRATWTGFLNLLAQTVKEKGYIGIWNFCATRDTMNDINGVKSQAADWNTCIDNAGMWSSLSWHPG